ncbi:nose resistant to fluoxetine protein 6 [Bombyx mori]|uniref:nose resistant to fluoxetine protein 6 n=1 Tax=Bombyx mori TaxID=7091 RepID=UPI002ECFAFA5
MVSRSHLGTSGINASIAITNACQTSGNHKEFDALFYYFVCTVGLLAVICLVCTFVSCSKQLNVNTTITQVIKAFCMKENASNLFKMRRDGLEAIYGVKWLTMCLIAVDHLISIVNSGPISDGYTSDRVVRSFFGLFLVHNDLFVDTFFFLSGLLTFSAFTTYEKLPNPFLIIFKRYIRLIVALAVVIFYVCAVHTYTGNGPLWNKLVDLEIELCRKNWWLNLLMINNYVDTENMCLIISWYIPCDFHFFVITVFWFSIYKKYPKAGLIAASVMFMIALSLPGIITYLYRLSAVQIFTIEFLVNPRGSHDLHVLYIKSHARYATYLVGVLFGFIFAKYKAEGKLNTVSKKWTVLFAIIASTLMLAVLVYGGTFIWREYWPLESAIYAALNRPAWAFGMGLLIMCCAFGQLPLINGILTWYPWVPVSRLTYGIYFTHTIIIARNVFITRNLQHNDYFKILVDGTGTIFWSCIFALLLWLLAEAPINKLIDICLRSLIRKGEKRAQEVSEGNGNSQKNFKSIDRDNFAKEENLSTNIQLESKM